MDIKSRSVVILTSNKFLAKLQIDLFRQIGVSRVTIATDPKEALKLVWDTTASIVILDLSECADERLQLVRSIRCLKNDKLRRAFVFAASNRLTAALVERCRIIGANAAIGIPHSRSSLINTVEKVVAKPKPFIDCESYIGPCRRSGIVAVPAMSKRRSSDMTEAFADRATEETKC